jgi:hypothetical protein
MIYFLKFFINFFINYLIGFSVTYILQSITLKKRFPNMKKTLFIGPSIVATIISFEVFKQSINKCKEKFKF